MHKSEITFLKDIYCSFLTNKLSVTTFKINLNKIHTELSIVSFDVSCNGVLQ